MRFAVIAIDPLVPSTASDIGNAVRVTARFIIEAHGDPHLHSPDFTFVVRGRANIAAVYQAAGFTIPPASGRAGSGTTPRGYQPMTTTVIVRPAGHHVRVTTIDRTGASVGRTIKTADELAPGSAERTFYVHSTLDLKVEEFDPTETTPQDGVTDARIDA